MCKATKLGLPFRCPSAPPTQTPASVQMYDPSTCVGHEVQTSPVPLPRAKCARRYGHLKRVLGGGGGLGKAELVNASSLASVRTRLQVPEPIVGIQVVNPSAGEVEPDGSFGLPGQFSLIAK